MQKDRLILTKDLNVKKATKLIKKLPKKTPKDGKHKFVFTKNKQFVIGRANKGNPRHRKLGNPKTDEIAGYVYFTFKDEELVHVYMNNQSADFDFPKFENLKSPQIFITKLFGPITIEMENIPKPKSKVIDLSNLKIH